MQVEDSSKKACRAALQAALQADQLEGAVLQAAQQANELVGQPFKLPYKLISL
jgi:hypothetical protein